MSIQGQINSITIGGKTFDVSGAKSIPKSRAPLTFRKQDLSWVTVKMKPMSRKQLKLWMKLMAIPLKRFETRASMRKRILAVRSGERSSKNDYPPGFNPCD